MQQPRATPSERREVTRERVALLYRKGAPALIATVVNGSILAWFLWGQVSASWLLTWAGTVAAIVVARAALLRAYRLHATARGVRFWECAFAAGAAANGVAWGVGATVFIGTELVYSMAVVFIVGGMVAGASATTSTSMPVYAGFTVPALLPVAVRLLVSGEPLRVVMGITLLVFAVGMALVAAQGGQALVEAVRLRLRNSAMAEELSLRTRERAGRLQALLDHAGVVTIVADPGTGRIVDASRNIMHLLGVAECEVIGRKIHTVAQLDELSSVADWDAVIDAARREEYGSRSTLHGADGKRYLELTVTIRRVEGTEYALVVLRDVTTQRELEAQLARSSLLASLGTLLAGVAHEINNPLANILGNLRYASGRVSSLGTDAASVLDEPLDDAIVGAQRIGRIVQDLTATARSASEGPVAIEPRMALETCLRIAENELRHRAVVELDCEPTPPVCAEPLRLNQVLLNLLLNAAEAIPEGHASTERITVRLRYLAAEGRVAISVHDTGRGIPLELIDRVFEPFVTTRCPGRSAGLGLSICHAVVTSLGGSIHVDSPEGEGTRFTVKLPVVSLDELPTEVPASTPMTAAAPQRFRLLVLDDDRSVARSLARLLSQHDVVVETRAEVALERLRADAKFDAVLCDIMMPETTGADFYERLREFNPELVARIVFITGGTFTESTRRFLDEVPNPCLKKPFDLGEVERAIGLVVTQDSARGGIRPESA